MSLSNMGEREKAGGEVRGKKNCHGNTPTEPLFRAKGRDTLMAEELKVLTDASKDRNGVLNIDPDRQIEAMPARGKGKTVKRNMDSNIFGDAKLETPPTLRVRADPGPEALTALMGHDTRKEDAANKMGKADNMVQQMVTNQYPVPINKEVHHAQAKKRYDGDGVSPRGGVDGFANMGAKSHAREDNAHLKRPGVSTKVPEPFVAPDAMPGNKFKGKKIVGPSDSKIFD